MAYVIEDAEAKAVVYESRSAEAVYWQPPSKPSFRRIDSSVSTVTGRVSLSLG